mmetsp:Transcript_29337/g.78766  ORF Transcript_29337/g.78766 Transcript_29337/m.78766 type:complete len:342 (-) Transcript_29337:813-1838(-)
MEHAAAAEYVLHTVSNADQAITMMSMAQQMITQALELGVSAAIAERLATCVPVTWKPAPPGAVFNKESPHYAEFEARQYRSRGALRPLESSMWATRVQPGRSPRAHDESPRARSYGQVLQGQQGCRVARHLRAPASCGQGHAVRRAAERPPPRGGCPGVRRSARGGELASARRTRALAARGRGPTRAGRGPARGRRRGARARDRRGARRRPARHAHAARHHPAPVHSHWRGGSAPRFQEDACAAGDRGFPRHRAPRLRDHRRAGILQQQRTCRHHANSRFPVALHASGPPARRRGRRPLLAQDWPLRGRKHACAAVPLGRRDHAHANALLGVLRGHVRAQG